MNINTMPSNTIQDNDWGLFIDIDSNNVHIHPEVTINKVDVNKAKFDTIPYIKNPSNFEHCFQYLYYYWGVYIIQYVHK
jgi:hypothetical protein